MNSTARASTLLATAGSILLTVGACDILTDAEPPRSARAELDGPSGTPVSIVASSDFEIATSEGGTTAELNEADTITASIPTSLQRDISSRRRVYFEVAYAGDSASAPDSVNASLTVFINGDRKGGASGNLIEQNLTFLFRSLVP